MSTALPPTKQPAKALWRAVRLRCPVCGQGRLFRNWFTMHPRCDHCGVAFEREPGFFLGSIYFNYGLTALLVIAAFLILFFTEIIPQQQAFFILLAFSILFPVWFFRYARSLWLAFDHHIDPRQAQQEELKNALPRGKSEM